MASDCDLVTIWYQCQNTDHAMNMPTGDKILLASEKVHTNILCLRLELLFFSLPNINDETKIENHSEEKYNMSAITGTKNNNLIQRHIIQRLNELIHESTEN